MTTLPIHRYGWQRGRPSIGSRHFAYDAVERRAYCLSCAPSSHGLFGFAAARFYVAEDVTEQPRDESAWWGLDWRRVGGDHESASAARAAFARATGTAEEA
jgi:hypothetical protein